jgi:hypothetical protein
VISEAVGLVSFRVDTEHLGNIRSFDEALIEHLLSEVIEFVGEDSSLHSNIVISFFTHHSVQYFREPPNTYVVD